MIDGLDHINIYSKGQTLLGRQLSNFTYAPINTTDGSFQSVEGYWYWLSAPLGQREQLRTLHGWQAKQVGRDLGCEDYSDDGLFKLKILNALTTKLISHPEILKQFKENKLPFKHYYVYGGKTVEPTEGRWVVDYFNFLRGVI